MAGLFYALLSMSTMPNAETAVVCFDREAAAERPWTEKLWIYRPAHPPTNTSPSKKIR